MTEQPPPARLGAFDLKILQILQADNTLPQRAIGKAVHLSAPAVQRRIRQLSEEGVIQSNVAILNPNVVGPCITVLGAVEIVRKRLNTRKPLKLNSRAYLKFSNVTT